MINHCESLCVCFGALLTVESYSTGLRTMIIMVSIGIASAAVQVIVYVVHNRRVAQGKHRPKDGSEPMVYFP